MRTNTFIIKGILSITLMISFLSFGLSSMAQNEVVRQTRNTAPFDKIDIGGAFEVELTIGEPIRVEVETREKYLENIDCEVNDEKLTITSRKVNQSGPLNVYITVPALSLIELHGAADLKSTNTLKTDMLSVLISGAASANLDLDVNTLRTEASGASDLDLTGKAGTHSTTVSGAATVNAKSLVTETTDADVSGAGTAKVNAAFVTGNTSGAGEIITQESQPQAEVKEQTIVKIDEDGDTTYVHIPGTRVEVTETDDSVKVRIGNRVIIVDDEGNVVTRKHKYPKFNGHWAGIDIGLNGYVNSDFNMNFPKEYEYMDLRMEKSIAINLNFFEQNIPFSKNQKWGMLTGLGLTFNDYKFLRPTRLSMDSSALVGFVDQDINIRKSKLSAMYLSLPVLFEFQTAPSYRKNGFHINIGMIVSARLSSHTKKYYDELNKEFNVTLYNPETGQYDVVYTALSPNDPKEHHYGDWFLQPFKFEATARIGWNFLNFWANYSINSMFREGKGPELYPWSAGITLVSF